tara:strand:+ start:155 stop:448 length:294 start_codon:yes stop_codon:yes gene_type:complete
LELGKSDEGGDAPAGSAKDDFVKFREFVCLWRSPGDRKFGFQIGKERSQDDAWEDGCFGYEKLFVPNKYQVGSSGFPEVLLLRIDNDPILARDIQFA